MSVFQFLLIAAAAAVAGHASVRADLPPSSLPVILVHGMIWDLDAEDATWGRSYPRADGGTGWTGMIGFLQSSGLPYGGTIRPNKGQIRLPDDLEVSGSAVSSRDARLFVLKFSPYANTDGVGYKALELAEAIRQVCRWTGAAKVRLVAHSAGGLVARVYLQSALPGVAYRGDVDRLITISTPHLGSELASHWGDFLGTRATSVQPDAPLIRDLNARLDLPRDVLFASIVVRALAADSRDAGEELDGLVDARFLAGLPMEYRTGGDEVVHVRSQNLRLAACASRYEQATARPVQYAVARVADPTPGNISPAADRVHIAAASDPAVEHLVLGMLRDRVGLWQGNSPEQLAAWMDWQARLHASGVIEGEALGDHPMSRVSQVRLDDFHLADAGGDTRAYAFDGKAWSKNSWIPFRRRWTRVAGNLDLRFDEFGRVRTAEFHRNVP